MKKIYTLLLIFGIIQQSLFSQIRNVDRIDFNKTNFRINIGDNFDFGDFIIFNNNGNNCCEEEPLNDISFGYDIGAALTASALIQQARERALNQWFDRQHTVLKEEIERQLGQQFSNYNDARNTYFKFHERIGLQRNHTPIENKYNSRRLDKANKQSISLKNLKLLRLRENEIRIGNINNSSYGNFTYNGTSLDQIQSLSQLQNLWSNETNLFSDNNWRYENDKYLYYTVRNLGGLQNYNHKIFTDLFNKQLAFYNQYDRWEQLDLMQAFLNEIRPPLALPNGYISPQTYATSQYIEAYAINSRRYDYFLFDPRYIEKIIQNIERSTHHVDSRDKYADIEDAYRRWEYEKEQALNRLLNEVSLEDLIDQQLEENPFLLLDINCNQIQNWQSLAQHTPPQNVKDKIKNLQENHEALLGDWNIQYLNNAGGTIVNMDYFGVNITTLPNNPSTGQQFTSQQFLDYFRRNINNFVEGTNFSPYCEVSAICQQETNLWNSNNPLGAIIKLDIPINDGVVVCAEYTNNYWRFMTMEAPYDNSHPVSGTRQFGIEQNSNGSYNIYVRGVDRFESNLQENISYAISLGNPFFGADNLWESFQEKTKNFINQNGGTSTKLIPIHNRPDWNTVKDVLEGIKPISDLGCN